MTSVDQELAAACRATDAMMRGEPPTPTLTRARRVPQPVTEFAELRDELRKLRTELARAPQGQRWLTVAEVAARIGVATEHVRRLLRTSALKGDRVGRQWRVSSDALSAYMAGREQTQGPGQEAARLRKVRDEIRAEIRARKVLRRPN